MKMLFTLLGATMFMNTIAQLGTLDSTFGNNGIVFTSFEPSSSEFAQSIAIQKDGKIVSAGLADVSIGRSVGLTRHNADGSLDKSFNGNGKLIFRFGNNVSSATSVVIQSDGKIVVGGGAGTQFALARININGSLDTTFDGDGQLTTRIGTFSSLSSLAIQNDGKIIAGGFNDTLGDRMFTLTRYNTNGTLDVSFGKNGIVTSNFEKVPYFSSISQITSIAIQNDGKILAAGNHNSTTSSDAEFGLIRYNTDGSFDSTFDSDGKVITAFVGSANATSIASQDDGKIVVGGTMAESSYTIVALARYNSDGSLDNSFDSDGKVNTLVAPGSTVTSAIALESDGKILLAGTYYHARTNDFFLVKYNTNGVLDLKFGTNGMTITNTNTNNTCYAMKLYANRIYVAGSTYVDPQAPDFTLLAYKNNASPLPILFSWFIAGKINNGILLKWQTLTEQNIAYFKIERSGDGVTFSSIGTKSAVGNSSSANRYSFNDNNPLIGFNYYRLKTIDRDGKFNYSLVRKVKNEISLTIEVIPNLINNNILNVYVSSLKATVAEVIIITNDGRALVREKMNVSSGRTNKIFNIGNLNNGIYLIKIITANNEIEKRFIKTK